MSASESLSVEEKLLSPEQLERQARNAAARELQRVQHEANTTARKCLGCGAEFRSEGAHNRQCNRCRSRR